MSKPESRFVFIDTTGNTLALLGPAVRQVNTEHGANIHVVARSRDDLFDGNRVAACVAEVRRAEALILLPHGGADSIPGFTQLVEAARGKVLHVQTSAGAPETFDLARETSPDFGSVAHLRRNAYLAKGGIANLVSLLRFLAWDGTAESEPPLPVDVPTEGLYHPAYGGPDRTADYLAWARDRLSFDESVPVIGLWFYRTNWLAGDTGAIDQLIAEIEAQGAVPLCLFHMRFADADLDNLPLPALIDRYFRDGDRVLIDVLLSPMNFSISLYNRPAGAALAALDVPVLQLIVTYIVSAKHHRRTYPFSAVLAQEQMKLALLLNAINPAIGGVVIRGQKGTAKSTAARGLNALLPPLPDGGCPAFVDFPLGATEDMVIGSIDFEAAIRHGLIAFQPGLLSRAHQGVLYIDEVNLLDDHLVDSILDASESGENVVEREGQSLRHASRFILIGTMNPEEGELRPQLLDRFGLAVSIEGERDPALRVELLRLREAFDLDPDAFVTRFQADEAQLARRIAEARRRLPEIACPAHLRAFIAEICQRNHVAGHRADIVMDRAARAQPAGRSCSGRAAGFGGHGCQHHRTRRHQLFPPRPFHPGRHHESGGRRSAAPVAGPLRPVRTRRRTAYPGRPCRGGKAPRRLRG